MEILKKSEINTRLGIQDKKNDATDIASTQKPVTKCSERTLENTRDSAKWKPDGDRGECGTPTILNNILAGEIAKNGEFPYMVILKYEGDEYKCGGSLINKKYVLTAKHCITDNLRQAVFGDYILENDPDCIVQGNIKRCPPKAIVRNVNKSHAIIHEKYDIALIRLDELVPLHIEDPEKSIVAPVCLPWKDSDEEIIAGLEDNEDTLLAGWGLVTNLGRNSSNEQRTLRREKLKIVDCIDANDKQFCVAAKKGKKYEKDSCIGDSGGPLVARELSDEPWFQLGIRSEPQGDDCGNVNQPPGTYTRVASFMDWIKSQLTDCP